MSGRSLRARPGQVTAARHASLDALMAAEANLPMPLPGRCVCGARVELRYQPFRWVDPETGEACTHSGSTPDLLSATPGLGPSRTRRPRA